MVSRFAPLSESVNHHLRGIRRVGALSIGRRQLIFLIPFMVVGAGYLSTESTNNPNPNFRIPNRNNEPGLQSHAVAVPRYIPQNRPNYQGTQTPGTDLTVAKTNDTGGNATVGILFNWTLTVANGGTIDGVFADTETILQDPLPTGPVYGSPTAGNFNSITNSEFIICSIDIDVLTCTAVGGEVTIGAGGSFTVSISATPAAPGSLENTATVDPDDRVAESDEGNNTGPDTVTVILLEPDLSAATTNDTGGVGTIGVPFNWTLTVANGGTSDGTFANTETILYNPLADGPTYGDPIAGNFVGITNSENISCSIDANVLLCTAVGGEVTIGAGGSFTVTFSATPAITGYLDNTATVDPDDCVAESDELNNTGSDTVTVILLEPDLMVAKENDTGGNATVGILFNWTLTVANGGTSGGTFLDADTILRDPLPAGPTYGDPTAGNFVDITNSEYISCSITTDVLTCTANGADVTIGAGGSFTVIFAATPAAPGSLENTATVDPDDYIGESNEGNNTGSDTVTVASPVPDLTIAKANDTGGNATVGYLFNWTLTVANSGTSDGIFANTETILQDTLPAGPVYGSPTAGNFNSITNSEFIICSIDIDVLTCTAVGGEVTIGAGGSFTVTFPVTPAAPGSLDNTATVDPNNNVIESDELNNTGSDSVTVASPTPDLTIAKANDTGGNATVGYLFNWTLTVANGGTSDGTFADGQTILQDPLPAGPVYGSPTAGNFNSITNSEFIICSIDIDVLTCTAVGGEVTIGIGGSFTVTFAATPAAPGSLDNTATVDPNSYVAESNELNNTGSDSVTVASPAPDLTIAKTNDTGGNATVGILFNWTLTVANGGTSDGIFANTETILQDTLPTGPAYGSPIAGDFISITNSEYISCSIDLDVLTCTAVGGEVIIGIGGSFTVSFSVTPAAPGSLDNTATVDPDDYVAESNEGNNTGSDSISVTYGVPGNDDIANAIPINALPFVSEMDTTWATSPEPNDDPYIACAAAPGQQTKTVWYSYYAAEFEALFIDTTASGYDTVVAVWRNTIDDGLAEVGCSEDGVLTAMLVAGTTYYIEVAQSGEGSGGALDFYAESDVFHGLRADYFNNVNLTGTPVLTRIDPFIAFDWTDLSPAPEVPLADYSVRWTGRVTPEFSETYTFHAYSDDGVRLWVDDQLIIDNWDFHPATWDTGLIDLQAGTPYSIRLEYFQSSGTGVAQLEWSSASVMQEIIPIDVLDYLDLEHSTVTADGLQPLADGVSASEIRVTVLDSSDHPVVGIPVYLKVSGTGNRINGSPAGPDVWVGIGNTDESGEALGYVASTVAGEKTVEAMAGGIGVGSPVIVLFIHGPVRRISVSHIPGQEGAESNGDSLSPSISHDGSRVAFLSWATNLFSGDLTSDPDIFSLNTGTNILSPAIFAESGGQPDELVTDPRISGDGRFIVFTSFAGNLSTSCSDGLTADIYLYEIQEGAPGTFTCISIGPGGVEANGSSDHPYISRDGQYVVFASTANNLVAGVTGATRHIYLADLSALPEITISLISQNSDEEPGNGDSDNPSISADGRYVAFDSAATNLLGLDQDTNSASDIFLRDRTDGVTTRVSVAYPDGEPNGSSIQPSISDDGTRVAFLSNANNIYPDLSGYWNVYLRVIPSSSTLLASISTTGGEGNGDASFARISADGMHIVFSSTATNLTADGGSGIEQIYLRDYDDSETLKISVSAEGAEGDGASTAADISSDGTAIAFISAATNLVAGDTNGYTDAFLAERVAPVRAPANDDFASALSITSVPYSNLESTLGATRGGDDPLLSCGGESPSQHYRSVWFTVQPSSPIRLALSTAGSDYDTVLAVWTGERGNLQEIACNDDSDGLQSELDFLPTVGTQYWIEVVNKNVTGASSLVFSMQEMPAPPVLVYVLDTSGTPDVGLTVRAFIGEVDTGYSAVTNSNGEATLTLPEASNYRFQVVKNGKTYWSGTCAVPGCPDVEIVTIGPVTVAVKDTAGNPDVGFEVQVFTSSGYAGYSGTTNALGEVSFLLPEGNYHFRVTKNLTSFWSGDEPHCVIQGCTIAPITTNIPITITVLNGADQPEANLWVHVFDDAAFAGLSARTDAEGKVSFTLPDGDYRFRADKLDRVYWSDTGNHCFMPLSCSDFTFYVYSSVVVHVEDTLGNPDVGIPVRAFLGETSAALAFTDSNGDATLQVPNGDYSFRAMKGGTAFWSGAAPNTPTCTVSACSSDSIITNVPVTITVLDGGDQPVAGMLVHVFEDSTFAGLSSRTDAEGKVRFALPDGEFRFRADKLDRVYWSDTGNHCIVPTSCADFILHVDSSVVVHVEDTLGNPDVGIPVRAFLGENSVALAFTDAFGDATLQVPNDAYSFRAMKGGTAFWSGADSYAPTCTVPACLSDAIITNVPITITVLDGNNQPEANILVHVFNESAFAGLSARTDAYGKVSFTLPDGEYRFRADKLDRVYWSDTGNHCFIPGSCSDFTLNVYNSVVVHVEDTLGNPDAGIPVRAFLGENSVALAFTDSFGDATLQVPNGDYSFRAMKGGTAFWSGADSYAPTCTVPACLSDAIITNVPVVVNITSDAGPEAGVWIHAYDNLLYTGLSARTDANGNASFVLPDGDYRFRADKLDRVYWSESGNHCGVPNECTNVYFSINNSVVVHIEDTLGNPDVGIPVLAFAGEIGDYLAITDANGDATLQVPSGVYSFRAMKGGTAFWSGAAPNTPTCTVPACSSDAIITNVPVTITVLDSAEQPVANILVHAFQGDNFAGLSFRTDAEGKVRFTLPDGDYRFRADKLDRVYWSDTGNHCFMPSSCSDFTLHVSNTVVVHVEDTLGNPDVGIPVRAFLGETSEVLAFTDSNGDATLQVPNGDYSFRAMKGGTAFWSGAAPNTPTCTVPACSSDGIITNVPITITVLNGADQPEAGILVHVFDDSAFAGLSARTDAEGKVRFTLPDGEFRFRADKLDRVYWSDTGNHCFMPASCSDFILQVVNTVVVHVEDTLGNPDVGIPVRAFLGETSEVLAFTDSNGDATLQVPSGDYSFRAMKGGTAFWSGAAPNTPTCTVPACSSDAIITNVSVTITVLNGADQPEAGLLVHVFDDSAFAGLSARTDAEGKVRFALPDGDYRFRADKLDRVYWSDTGNHCFMPASCSDFTLHVYSSVVVHVEDTLGNPDVGIPVRAFLGETSVALAFTDAFGNATLQVPNDAYSFRAMKGGTAFWSGADPYTPTCTVPACLSDAIITNVPVVVTVTNNGGQPKANVWVHVFVGDNFAGLSFQTDSNGQARFTLPDGGYRFRADTNDQVYWSGIGNHCTVPSCTDVPINTGEDLVGLLPGIYGPTCAITAAGETKCLAGLIPRKTAPSLWTWLA